MSLQSRHTILQEKKYFLRSVEDLFNGLHQSYCRSREGERGTHSNGLYGKSPPKRVALFKL